MTDEDYKTCVECFYCDVFAGGASGSCCGFYLRTDIRRGCDGGMGCTRFVKLEGKRQPRSVDIPKRAQAKKKQEKPPKPQKPPKPKKLSWEEKRAAVADCTGDALRSWRKAHGISVPKVAVLVGVAKKTIEMYEHGTVPGDAIASRIRALMKEDQS